MKNLKNKTTLLLSAAALTFTISGCDKKGENLTTALETTTSQVHQSVAPKQTKKVESEMDRIHRYWGNTSKKIHIKNEEMMVSKFTDIFTPDSVPLTKDYRMACIDGYGTLFLADPKFTDNRIQLMKAEDVMNNEDILVLGVECKYEPHYNTFTESMQQLLYSLIDLRTNTGLSPAINGWVNLHEKK